MSFESLMGYGILVPALFVAGGYGLLLGAQLLVAEIVKIRRASELGILRWGEFGTLLMSAIVWIAGVCGIAVVGWVGGGTVGAAAAAAAVGAGLSSAYIVGAVVAGRGKASKAANSSWNENGQHSAECLPGRNRHRQQL